ncbi:MAG: hypothetical protein L3K17_06755 [Thermoplasmata archaeon]|nr:hypothetical protein [Thermoplasmata archaeon]
MPDDAEEDPGKRPILPRLTGEARRRALAEPGPSWSEWFYRSFARTWIVLGFFILDVFIIATWGAPLNLLVMVSALVLAIYGEFLLYEYLWYQPRERRHHRPRTPGPFRPTWLRPVEYGRWSADAALIRAGKLPATIDTPEVGPDPREFL